ncbi:MAG: response regulator [Anaerolineae bacterium]|nr:response regulator [Anaerolineae bacterium]
MEKQYALVVDDNPDAREILDLALTRFGFEVELACDGAEALESTKKRIPDLIMLDLMMPGVNGFQVLSRLRALPETRHIPVIVISAVSNQSLMQVPGVSAVIQKSRFSVRELQSIIDGVMAKHQPLVRHQPLVECQPLVV